MAGALPPWNRCSAYDLSQAISSEKVGVPLWGNIRHNKQLNRFTLRGQRKVDAQWKLYCLVHNIEKLAHHGYAP